MSLTIEERVLIGNFVRGMLNDMINDLPVESAGAINHFWSIIYDEGKKHCPSTATKDEQMTYEEARAFEEQPMPFGRWKGMSIRDIDIEYLQYVTDPNPFQIKLRKYVDYRTKLGD